ncbi:hypothetical protein BJY00DRAFT_313922 [Aspergillus carlsbadensis]|nr:hypothetical protein BJY00DRAFT_313922 [Aspergillus carlsbadensis]
MATPTTPNPPKTVAIIGSGWSGCHTALELSSTTTTSSPKRYTVTILEKAPAIFASVSGQFGIRIHRGPHYPRSSGTRESCRRSFDRFTEQYRDLVVPVDPAVYSLARECSTADVGEFVRGGKSALSEVECAFKLDEPCAFLNPYLRAYFWGTLRGAGVRVELGVEVVSVRRVGDGTGRQCVVTKDGSQRFYDAVINATGYTSALPDGLLSNLPIKADIRYQACIALHYRDTKIPTDPSVKPLSFIVMDGWFPCLMPSVGEPGSRGEYVLTHGAYTILGSFHTPAMASQCLTNLTTTPAIMECEIKPKIESEMERFWPGFTDQFVYQGWKGSVLPKMVTDTEYRSSITSDEVLALLDQDGGQRNVTRHAGYAYASDSELNRSRGEIEQRPVAKERNTCFLQTQQSLALSV